MRGPGWDVWIGIDAAASQLRQDGRYALAHEGRYLSSVELASYYDELTDRYPVLLLEDGMGEGDWVGWRELTGHLGRRLELAGDDLFATTAARLREGIAARVAKRRRDQAEPSRHAHRKRWRRSGWPRRADTSP